VLLLLALVAPVPPASAQAPVRDDPMRFLLWPFEDAKAFVPAVASPRTLLGVAGAGALLLVLTETDPGLARQADAFPDDPDHPLSRFFNEAGNVRSVKPMVLLLFLGSLTTDDHRFQDAAFTSLEAVFLSNLLTDGLKDLVGRGRPWLDEGALYFRPFSGSQHRSFPSGHTTTIFAATTPLLLYYPSYSAAGLFILGLGTGVLRLVEDVHWFTDVVAGGAIGVATGYWLAKRHLAGRPDGEVRRFSVEPLLGSGQIGLTFRVRP
jgi:membrane-associated phospholipid phosphatase